MYSQTYHKLTPESVYLQIHSKVSLTNDLAVKHSSSNILSYVTWQ